MNGGGDEPAEDDLRSLLDDFASHYKPDRQRLASLLDDGGSPLRLTGLALVRPAALGAAMLVAAITLVASVLAFPDSGQPIVAVDAPPAETTTGPSPVGPSTSESSPGTTTSIAPLDTATTRVASRLSSTTSPVGDTGDEPGNGETTTTEEAAGQGPATTDEYAESGRSTTIASIAPGPTTRPGSSSTTTTGSTTTSAPPTTTTPAPTKRPTTTAPSTSRSTTTAPTTTTASTTTTPPSTMPVDRPDSCYVQTDGIEVFDDAFEFAYSYDFHGQNGELILNTSSLGPPDDIETRERSIEWTVDEYGYPHELVYYVAASEADGSSSDLVYCRRHVLLD